MKKQASYSEILDKLEDAIEEDFNENEIENYAYDLSRKLRKNWDILRLASIIRWADFKEEERGVEIAQNIVDKAIEQAVSNKSIEDLNIIYNEVKHSMELEDRAEEVRHIIKHINDG
tara:strand:+ start:909 stop:1259 length:351 start_codon:yes stop_codon:yes gene_type:complete